MTQPQPPAGADAAASPSLDSLAARLQGRLSTDPTELAAASRDESRAAPAGPPLALVLAASTEDVRETLRWAGEHGVPVVLRGAGTGLSGGAVAHPGGLVLSLAGMRRILELDPANRLAVVQPGVVVAELDAAAAEHGLRYAPDPASAAWCTIGGTIATNAGGLRCLAYGATREAVLGLEVVLADGRVLRTGSRTRKLSTGYHLTGLFIGSEGTLGVITEATVRLVPRPQEPPVAFLGEFDRLEDAGAAVAAVLAGPVTPELLELMDRRTLEAVERVFPSGRPVPEAAVLVGQCTGPAAAAEAAAVVAAFLAAGARRAELGEGEELLASRRQANPALSASGLRFSCDVAVPPGSLVELLRRIEAIGAAAGHPVSTFAHAGDGNLHPSVEAVDDSPEAAAAAEAVLDAITEAALQLGGVISGEHGIGTLKLGLLRRQFDPVSLELQRGLKALLDPVGVLGPGRGPAAG